MKLFQLKDGYHYNSDSLVLYDFVSSFLKPNFKGKALDVGCGCGIIGMLLKRDFSQIELNMLDVLDVNLKIASKNLKENGIEANLILDDFANFKSNERFDLIVSNPPYYHSEVKKSTNNHIATSRYQDALNLDSFLSVANSHLKPNGELYFCYEIADLVLILSLFKKYKLTCTHLKFIYPKECLPANLVLFKIKKNSRSKCVVLPPMFMKDGENDSQEAVRIYKKSDTKSEFCQF